jgi:hypothetical protein
MTLRILSFLIVLVHMGALAQTPQAQLPKSRTKSNKTREVSPIRQSALSTLDTVLDELPDVDDLGLRTELTETVVKLLAKSRPDHCQKALDLLFSKAMELKSNRPKDGPERSDPDLAIRRIIQIAAVLDRKLAESYIKVYTEEENFKGEDTSSRQKNSQIAVAYLKIATQLVEKDVNLAVLTAARSLNTGIMSDTLVFLATLRKKDVGLANRFFIDALLSCQARKGKDVNELLLLYAFVFSPLRVPVATPRGIGVYSIGAYLEGVENYPVDASLAKQYLVASSRMLLDPDRYRPENTEELTGGAVGDFYFLSIIEPKASEYLPNVAQTFSEQRNVLANYLQAGDRTGAFAAVDRWNSVPKEANLTGPGNSATVDFLISKAERTSDPKLRDQFYFRAALAAVDDKQDERAVELAAKLSPEYSDQAQQLVKFNIAVRKVRNGQFDEAEQLARHDDVLVRRCYVFTLIADSLLSRKTKDVPRATRLLDEVQQLAQKLSQREKLSVLEGVAAAHARLDLAKAFDLFRETIKTANKLDGFTGALSIAQSLDVRGFLFDFSIYDKEFSFFGLVGRLGAGDFYQALQDTREIQNRALRIHSTVAVCSAALSTN